MQRQNLRQADTYVTVSYHDHGPGIGAELRLKRTLGKGQTA